MDHATLSRHDEHLADTRAALIAAGRGLFAARGYCDTSVTDIAARARLTPGALFHHFGSKAGLFTVVLEEVERDFVARLAMAGAPGAPPWEELANGCQAFLDVALDPEVRQIRLVDGPVVLGWSAWRAIEERYGFGLLRAFLGRAVEQHFLPDQPLDPLVCLVSGALDAAVLYIANAADRARARREMGAAVAGVLDRLGRTPARRRAKPRPPRQRPYPDDGTPRRGVPARPTPDPTSSGEADTH